jgi:hypothetical protein
MQLLNSKKEANNAIRMGRLYYFREAVKLGHYEPMKA